MAGIKIKIDADASEFDKAMKSVRGSISSFRNMVAGFVGTRIAIDAISTAARGMGTALKYASDQAGDMEMLQMSFETLTGSAEKAKELIADFRQEAQKSPLTTRNYADAGKTLMAFGMAAEDTMGVLKMLGDISLGNSERFGNLSLAYAQVTAAGRLMGQDLLQLVNAGFNPLQTISKRTGESMLQLKKRMEDGGISAAEVTSAFRAATSEGGLFFNAIQKGATTFQGKMAGLQDGIDSLAVAFGTGMNEGLKDAADAISQGMPLLNKSFTEAGQILGNAISEAVKGDAAKLAEVGVFIGETIASGIKVGIKYGLAELGTTIVGGVAKYSSAGIAMRGLYSTVGGDFGKTVNQGMDFSRTANREQAIIDLANALTEAQMGASQLRASNLQIQGFGGSIYRPAMPGETSPFRDANGEVLILLKDISESVKPQPFSN